MRFSSVYADFYPYKNVNGMYPYCGTPPCVSQNDTLFTCYAYLSIMAVLDEYLEQGEAEAFEKFRQELTHAYEKHLRVDGSTLRTPQSDELDSNDNLMAWAVMSYCLNKSWASLILGFAREHGWIWPGDGTVLQRWLGRHRAAEAHLMLGTEKEKPDFLLQLFWLIALFTGDVRALFRWITRKQNPPDADGFSLSYLMVILAEWVERTPKIMRLGAALWRLLHPQTLGWNLAANYGWAQSPHAKYFIIAEQVKKVEKMNG